MSSTSDRGRLNIDGSVFVDPVAANATRPPRVSASTQPRRRRKRKYSGGRSTLKWVFFVVGVGGERLPWNLTNYGELRRGLGWSVNWTATGRQWPVVEGAVQTQGTRQRIPEVDVSAAILVPVRYVAVVWQTGSYSRLSAQMPRRTYRVRKMISALPPPPPPTTILLLLLLLLLEVQN